MRLELGDCPMMALKPGTIFAKHYEVVRTISAGGMGIVYEVFHKETKRRRALKVMLPHVFTDPLMRERFALEAVVTAEIESEHLVEVFDAGIDDESNSPFIVMELLRGEDLAARLKRGERYSAEETLTFLEQACRALEKTHARGIVHRDLKPENLFLTERDDGSPRLKILDFGIAKVIKETSIDARGTTKSVGTPFYMAREQITGEGQLIGPPSDLYAIAQIAYSMLVGTPYFEDEANQSGNNMLTLLIAVGRGPPEPPSARALRRGVGLPVAFDDWFLTATQAAPNARFQTARSMVAALKDALREGVQVFAPSGGAVSAATPAGRSTGNRTPVSGPFAPAPLPSAPRQPYGSNPSYPNPYAATPYPVPQYSAPGSMPGMPGSGPGSHPGSHPQMDAFQTGSPQSIPRQAAPLQEKPKGNGKIIAVAIGAAVLAAGTMWFVTKGPTQEPPAANTAPPIVATTPEATTQTATAAPTVSPAGTATQATPAVTSDATASASASASASGGAPTAVRTGPRTTATAKPTGTATSGSTPIWETR